MNVVEQNLVFLPCVRQESKWGSLTLVYKGLQPER